MVKVIARWPLCPEHRFRIRVTTVTWPKVPFRCIETICLVTRTRPAAAFHRSAPLLAPTTFQGRNNQNHGISSLRCCYYDAVHYNRVPCNTTHMELYLIPS